MTSEQTRWRSATSWGTEKLTRAELLTLGPMLHRAWDACVRVANRSDGAQMREFFAVGSEMCGLWGEAADELIVRRERALRPEAGAEPEVEL